MAAALFFLKTQQLSSRRGFARRLVRQPRWHWRLAAKTISQARASYKMRDSAAGTKGPRPGPSIGRLLRYEQLRSRRQKTFPRLAQEAARRLSGSRLSKRNLGFRRLFFLPARHG